MFDFKPSKELVQKFVENLRSEMQAVPEIPITLKIAFDVTHAPSKMEEVRSKFGKDFVGCIGMYAQRARYEPAATFSVVKDGRFSKQFEDDICGSVFGVPEGENGDRLFAELAKEFIEWVKTGDNATAIHPRAPIAKFEYTETSVIAHVKPLPPKKPSTWIKAKILE